MKYVNEYRDEAVAHKVTAEIRRTVTKPWVLMETCGGQTHSVVKYGLDQLLTPEVEVIHGA
jgi:hydrogenase expression/formation protein HypD